MIIAKLNLLTEMPKTCAYCPYALHCIGFISCDLVRVRGDIRTKLYGDITKRPDGCPLEEVEDENQTPRYCDRNICASNEVNGVSCDECWVAQNYNLEDDDSPCLNCGVEE